MIITFFSDQHGIFNPLKLPQNSDILICGGDFMTDGYSIFEFKSFLNWFSEQKATHRILVGGNHDRLLHNMPSITGAILKEEHPDIIYLENSGVEIEGIKFWGTPNSKLFYNWAFNNSEEELEQIFAKIPEDTEILISHAPPYGILDEYKGEHLGEKTLSERIKNLPNLKYVLTGHIHDNNSLLELKNYTLINGAVLDNQYRLKYKPITFYV